MVPIVSGRILRGRLIAKKRGFCHCPVLADTETETPIQELIALGQMWQCASPRLAITIIWVPVIIIFCGKNRMLKNVFHRGKYDLRGEGEVFLNWRQLIEITSLKPLTDNDGRGSFGLHDNALAIIIHGGTAMSTRRRASPELLEFWNWKSKLCRFFPFDGILRE